MQKRLKVLEIVQPVDGGAAANVDLLTDKLDKGRFDVFLASPLKGIFKKLKSSKIKKINLNLVREISPISDFQNFLKIIVLIRKNKFDIVHTHSSKAGFLARLAARIGGVPVILYTPHGFGYIQFKGFKRELYKLVERFAASLSDRILVQSESEKTIAIEDKIAPIDKFQVIENSIDAKKFNQKTSLPDFMKRMPIGSLFVTMVARLERPKRPEDLIRAAEIVAKGINKIYFLFVGDGSLRKSMERLTTDKSLGERVLFLGHRDDIPSILHGSHVFVLASSSEGMPAVVLEAMAAKKPVIGTDTKGIKDVIENGTNGYLFKDGDYKSLAKYIMSLVKNKTLATEFGKEGYKRITRRFSVGRMITKIERVYLDLYNSKKGVAAE